MHEGGSLGVNLTSRGFLQLSRQPSITNPSINHPRKSWWGICNPMPVPCASVSPSERGALCCLLDGTTRGRTHPAPVTLNTDVTEHPVYVQHHARSCLSVRPSERVSRGGGARDPLGRTDRSDSSEKIQLSSPQSPRGQLHPPSTTRRKKKPITFRCRPVNKINLPLKERGGLQGGDFFPPSKD